MIPDAEVERLKREIKENKVSSWQDVHQFYINQGMLYPQQKSEHALASLLEMKGVTVADVNSVYLLKWLDEALETSQWITDAIYRSRQKDYTNPFRQITYDSEQERDKVLGKLEDNSFIQDQQKEQEAFAQTVRSIQSRLSQSMR